MRDANAVLTNATLTATTTSATFNLTPVGGAPFEGIPFCAKFDTAGVAALASGTGTLDCVIQGFIGGVWTTGWTMPQQALSTAALFYEFTKRFQGPKATALRAVVTITGTTPSIPTYISAVTGDNV